MKKIFMILLIFSISILYGDTLFQQAARASQNGQFSKAYTLMREAARKGDIHAQVNVGLMYEYGQGVKKDLLKAKYWYEKASEAGDPKAAYNLGLLYENGSAGEQNITKALMLFQQAAQQHNVNAQYHLGVLFSESKYIPPDLSRAAYWYKAAADNGLSEAQFRFGSMLVNGQGVKLNKIAGFGYLMKAARQSHLQAQKSLDILCRQSPWACK